MKPNLTSHIKEWEYAVRLHALFIKKVVLDWHWVSAGIIVQMLQSKLKNKWTPYRVGRDLVFICGSIVAFFVATNNSWLH